MKEKIKTFLFVLLLMATIFIGRNWSHTALDFLMHVGFALLLEIVLCLFVDTE